MIVVLIGLLLAVAGCGTENQDQPSSSGGESSPTAPAPETDMTLNLTGNTWELDAIVDGNDSTRLPQGAKATIIFTKKSVQTHSGCNGGGGSVKISDDTLAFGPLMTTLIGCPEKWKQQVETAYGDVLRNEATYAINGPRLTISKGDLRLEFVAR